MSVKKGDVVFYGKYSGTEVEVNDQTYVLVRENDVLAIVD
jgi:chaperonin GroES